MSTRVQKGGTVFKPVAKSRSRPPDAPRRVSSTPDPQGHRSSSVRPHDHDSATASTSMMPPPPTIPVRPHVPSLSGGSDESLESHSGDLALNRGSSQPPAIQVLPRGAAPPSQNVVPPQGSAQRLSTPSLQSTQPTPIATPSRAAPTPLAIGSRAIPSTAVRSSALSSNAGRPTVESLASTDSAAPATASISEPTVTLADVMSSAAMSQLPEPSAHDDLQNEFSAILEHAARLANGETAIADILQEDAAPRDSVSSGKPSRTRKKKATAGDAEAPTSKRVRRKRANDANGEQEDPDGEDAPKAKRKRRARRAPRDSEGEDEESPASTKRKRTSSRKSRSSSAAPVFDPNADPGEELDPTVVTMATLCEDTGQGRISSKAAQILDNHAAWKHSNRERRLRMKVLMEAKKYGRNDDDANNQSAISGPSENPDAAAGPSTSSSSAPLSSASTPAPPEVQSTSSEPAVDGSGSGFDYTQSMATSRFNVQIRIGPNGETIVDEESLYVDRAQDNDTENYTHVEESDATKFINSASYGKKYRGTRWSAEETELFYEAVSQFGENYELISYILPGRDRKACKAKFKNEDRKNPARITYCLDNRVPYDMKTLSRMTGKDFSGPTPVIRARTPLNLSEVTAEAEQSSPSAPRKQSRTPGLSEGDGADGAHDDMDTDLSSTHAAHDSGARATSVGSNKPPAKASGNSRKKGKNKKDDGVEVLGTIDDNQWDD